MTVAVHMCGTVEAKSVSQFLRFLHGMKKEWNSLDVLQAANNPTKALFLLVVGRLIKPCEPWYL